MKTLRQELNELEVAVSQLLGRKQALQDALLATQQQIEVIDTGVDLLDQARGIFQKVSTLLRIQISDQFAELATQALRYIFQRNDLEFLVELDVKANLPTAAFFVVVDGHKVNPKEALGGSIYEIIGICLRLVCLEVFDLKGPLVLDEPLRSVDEVNLQNALEFILQYCRQTGRQLIVVTHNAQIARSADKLFIVAQSGGISSIEEVVNE